MIADAAYSVVIGFITWLSGLIDSVWSPIAPTWNVGLGWFYRLDAWAPMTELVAMVAIVGALVVIVQVIKWGSKLIDWLPFTCVLLCVGVGLVGSPGVVQAQDFKEAVKELRGVGPEGFLRGLTGSEVQTVVPAEVDQVKPKELAKSYVLPRPQVSLPPRPSDQAIWEQRYYDRVRALTIADDFRDQAMTTHAAWVVQTRSDLISAWGTMWPYVGKVFAWSMLSVIAWKFVQLAIRWVWGGGRSG